MQNNYDLELKQIQLQNERVLRQLEDVRELIEKPEEQTFLSKEYYSVEEVSNLKGGCAVNTYKASSRFLLPGCGSNDPKYCVYIGGRLSFPRSAVLRWLQITDAELEDYARECGVNILPDKYLKLAQKAKQKAGGQ
jgi:hypothetical protein